MTKPLRTFLCFLAVLPLYETARPGGADAAAPGGREALWYESPAERWLEALPVGNGRLGAMVFGRASTERIALNESTVWSGSPNEHENPGARARIGEIRGLLFGHRYEKAQELAARYLTGEERTYGTHLPAGDLYIDFAGQEGEITGYRRELDMESGTVRVDYLVDGFHYGREILASHPHGVLAIYLTTSRPGGLSFHARPRTARTVSAGAVSPDTYRLNAQCGEGGVAYSIVLKIHAPGGVMKPEGSGITVMEADTAVIYCDIATDYGNASPDDAGPRTGAAASAGYGAIRAAHVEDHGSLFGRVDIGLSGTTGGGQPIDRRLAGVRSGLEDPGLAALFFQYARYLLIAGSRGDSPLPLNLQGIWNDYLACDMGWNCDFHLDINTQMNYWPAEAANLGECAWPLFRLIDSLREPGRKTARRMYGAPGWVVHVFTNAWGFTAPGWGVQWGLHPTAGAWLCLHLFDHFEYSGDRGFLAGTAYPIMKEAAEFFLDYLVEHPERGWLVSGPSNSPENAFIAPDGGHAYVSMGPACDRVLIHELFSNCIEASAILSVDEGFREEVQKALDRLPPLMTGRRGNLQEWLEDYPDAIPNHRHTSHLLALYPTSQITPSKTPELAAAARKTIEERLSAPDWEDVEWSRANMITYYARLGDGENALKSINMLLSELTDTNLFTFSAAGIAGAEDNIFAIDGNMGAASGIAEMLLQSHDGVIALLPALPAAWADGRIRGLRARGGFELDFTWKAGEVMHCRVRSTLGGPCRLIAASPVGVRGRDASLPVKSLPGGIREFDTTPGETYTVQF